MRPDALLISSLEMDTNKEVGLLDGVRLTGVFSSLVESGTEDEL